MSFLSSLKCIDLRLKMDVRGMVNAFKYVRSAIEDLHNDKVDLFEDLRELKKENLSLISELDASVAEKEKMESEIKEMKSTYPILDDTMKENTSELSVIVLENPIKKPYAEVLKATKQHFRNMNLPKEAVDHVRPGPKGKTIVVCASETDRTHILESLKTQTDLGARKAKERKRTLLIKNVPTSIKDSDFMAEVIENDDRFTTENMKLLRSFKIGGGDVQNLVICTNEGNYRLLKTHPHVYHDFERYTVNAYVSVKQCFNCSGFGHFASTCRATFKRCPSCSGDHSYKECSSLTLKCGLCSQTKNEDTAHKATSNRCPLRKKEFNTLVKKHRF